MIDCGSAWQAELSQQYGFWCREQALALLERTGLRLRHAEVSINRWVIEHRLKGRIEVFDAENGLPIEPQLTQILLVADRD